MLKKGKDGVWRISILIFNYIVIKEKKKINNCVFDDDFSFTILMRNNSSSLSVSFEAFAISLICSFVHKSVSQQLEPPQKYEQHNFILNQKPLSLSF